MASCDAGTGLAMNHGGARFLCSDRIGVLLVQQETNSFAARPGTLDSFTVLSGAEAEWRLRGANSEFVGALDELRERGATAVPLLYAHALPAGPLDQASYAQLRDRAIGSIREAEPLDGLVVCLHGALSSTEEPEGDRSLLAAIRDEVGATLPIALTLDLHGNATAELCALAQVVTGYRTNPHVDLAETGRRGVTLLAAIMTGELVPTTAVETCPAIFPDESLRIPMGILGRVLDRAVADAGESIVDISVFPTQPWLDAPGIGFTAVVLAHDDTAAARRVARTITRTVWQRRDEFVVDRLLAPADALAAAEAEAEASGVRPFVITEAADAPTAGATGDGTSMLHALIERGVGRHARLDVLTTIVDAAAVRECHIAGPGNTVSLLVGATLDPRWSPPAALGGQVERLGDGDYTLTGVGYTGMRASMGRFAVVRRGGLRVLITELPAWSADPGTWRHAGLDPHDVDVLIVRSCTDYLANFPASAATSVVADVPGVASPRLTRLRFERCGVVPYPVNPEATY